MKITIAITGASGSVYARRLVDALLRKPSQEVEKIYLILTDSGLKVMQYEQPGFDLWKGESRVERLDNHDFFCSVASGSGAADVMVVVPCSMGTLGRIAGGVSMDLTGRAADVMLKERRPLILCVRESPLSTIHLRNMTTLSETGALILPLCPSFYSMPQHIEQLVDTMTDRILQSLGLPNPEAYHWNGK